MHKRTGQALYAYGSDYCLIGPSGRPKFMLYAEDHEVWRQVLLQPELRSFVTGVFPDDLVRGRASE
jgi:hypothetical protein